MQFTPAWWRNQWQVMQTLPLQPWDREGVWLDLAAAFSSGVAGVGGGMNGRLPRGMATDGHG
jgi:hypothetical protein